MRRGSQESSEILEKTLDWFCLVHDRHHDDGEKVETAHETLAIFDTCHDMLTIISTPGVDDEKVESPEPEGVEM